MLAAFAMQRESSLREPCYLSEKRTALHSTTSELHKIRDLIAAGGLLQLISLSDSTVKEKSTWKL